MRAQIQTFLQKINARVFFPPALFLGIVIFISQKNNALFLEKMNLANNWILDRFGAWFTWSSFLFLVILAIVYFSKYGKIRIGGDAKPVLNKQNWFSVTLCTTIATGILFWGTAEPLFHLHTPPSNLQVTPGEADAGQFAVSTLFMHWSFTPYGIYTMAGLVFALSYYNLRQPFSISSLLSPLVGDRAHGRFGDFLNVLCLFGLAAGMAASLGTGIFALSGGLESIFEVEKTNFSLAIIAFAVVLTFIGSAASGLKKGIRILSNWNTKAFFLLAFIVFAFGSTSFIIKIGYHGFVDYALNFLPRSTNIGSELDESWQQSWTIFYLSNWFAWAPIAALFLGRIAVGYTVREFIRFNLIFPSIFACFWMMIFGGSAINLDFRTGGEIFALLSEHGEESVMYRVLNELPGGSWIVIFTLPVIFISYVTAADSNISAMSGVSSIGVNPESPEAPIFIKIIWGSLIGLTAWVMITSAGIDGIRMLCVLGGFPALFIIILAGAGIFKALKKSAT